MLLIKNANIYAPAPLGVKDILVGEGKILAIENHLKIAGTDCAVWDAEGKILTPGFIDQHMHITGAGGKRGFASMTPEIAISKLIACGTTTVVGLLGTDGSTRSVNSVFSKAKALTAEGITAYMFTGYYGVDPVYLMNSVQEDMIFIDIKLRQSKKAFRAKVLLLLQELDLVNPSHF